MANNNPPPPITVTTATSGPVTHSTTTTTTLGGRRNRPTNNDSNLTQTVSNTSNYYTPNEDNAAPEPFPNLPTPTPGTPRAREDRNDYFAQPPPQFRSQQRPISIRRLPSATEVRRQEDENGLTRTTSWLGVPRVGTRRRAGTGPSQPPPSSSANATAGLTGLPGHYELSRTSTNTMEPLVEGERLGGPVTQTTTAMEPLVEGEKLGTAATQPPGTDGIATQDYQPRRDSVGRRVSQRLRSASNAARSSISKLSDDSQQRPQGRDYDASVVDYLDVLDPEVSAMTTLTNIQNSLFVPDIPYFGRYLNRRPTFELTRGPSRISERPEMSPAVSRVPSRKPVPPTSDSPAVSRVPTRKPVPSTPAPPDVAPEDQSPEVIAGEELAQAEASLQGMARPSRSYSITSQVEDKHYAVLPHGVSLEDWSPEEREALDDYVRHMLHSRRSRFKRTMKAFGKYVRKPLGFFVTLYATLITLFGLAWVLFLIGWIYVGTRQSYIVNIIDNVLVALFAVVGDGLAPFRAVDTYHMIFIAHYHRLSWRLRKQKALPKLPDHNDLPEQTIKDVGTDPETGLDLDDVKDWQFSVLTPEQQKKLIHHQNKFSKSHSYYRPHETSTHYAFPLKLLITIVSLLDLHSLLQISLGAFTWGWSYHTRPGAITATILSCSITVNITAGILITIGDRKTRKKDVLLRMARQDLTQEAMRKVEKHKHDGKGLPALKPPHEQKHPERTESIGSGDDKGGSPESSSRNSSFKKDKTEVDEDTKSRSKDSSEILSSAKKHLSKH